LNGGRLGLDGPGIPGNHALKSRMEVQMTRTNQIRETETSELSETELKEVTGGIIAVAQQKLCDGSVRPASPAAEKALIGLL
jgi:bacteriocin-like protein